MSTKILATADIHVGRRPSKVPDEEDARRFSSARIWEAIVDRAIAEEVDLVALSGDVIDHDLLRLDHRSRGVEQASRRRLDRPRAGRCLRQRVRARCAGEIVEPHAQHHRPADAASGAQPPTQAVDDRDQDRFQLIRGDGVYILNSRDPFQGNPNSVYRLAVIIQEISVF